MLELNVLAFLPAQIAQPLADGGYATAAKFWREETEQPEPGELPRRLGLADEGRSEEDEGKEKDTKLHSTPPAFGLCEHSSTLQFVDAFSKRVRLSNVPPARLCGERSA